MSEKNINKAENTENIDFKGAIEKRDEILVEEDNVNMQLFLYDDQYQALADRTILLEEYGLSFDELLHETDATLNAYVDFPVHREPILTLCLESEEMGYKDYEVELTKYEQTVLRHEAEELLEKEYGTTFEMLYLEGELGKQVEPITFDDITVPEQILDLETVTMAKLNLSQEQLSELCSRADAQMTDSTYAVAHVYPDKSVGIEVANGASDIKTAPLTLSEQEGVINSLEKTLGKELEVKKFESSLEKHGKPVMKIQSTGEKKEMDTKKSKASMDIDR